MMASSSQNVFFSPSGQPFRAANNQPYPVMKWFQQADMDKDGKISEQEFLADALQFYIKLDVNHDDYISSPENTRYENEVAPEIQRIDPRVKQPKRFENNDNDPNNAGVPNNGKYLHQMIGASQYGLLDEPQPVRAADANFDFRVSKQEWINASEARFGLLDINADGFITTDELAKTPVQIAAETIPAGKTKKKGFGW